MEKNQITKEVNYPGNLIPVEVHDVWDFLGQGVKNKRTSSDEEKNSLKEENVVSYSRDNGDRL